jgi:AraC-like DNA-binding protein/ligand-binding sensor protein
MSDRPGFSPESYSLRLALRKLEHYSRATGVSSRLMDDKGQVLGHFDCEGALLPLPEGSRDCGCPVSDILGGEETQEDLRAHLFGAFQAERFGGKYIQLCPHSLLFWTAPVIVDGIMRAAFVGGPAMVLDPKEVEEELRASERVSEDRAEEIRSALDSVPRIGALRSASLAELLADEAASVSIGQSASLKSNRERQDQQARISEYIHDMKTESGKNPGRAAYPIEKERELLAAIAGGNRPEAQRLLNEILGHIFFSSGQDPAVLKARVLELVVLLSRATLEGGADIEQIFGLNFTYLNQIQRMRSVDDIAYWLSGIMTRFSELVFTLKNVKHAGVMQKALKYINARYTESLTLDDVAGAVFLSPTYFSKIFNEEMKCRFTTHLNNLRIAKARLLLRNSDISLVDIAGLVGYEDQSYFTKMFKKIVGVSPGRFREAGGWPEDSQEIHDD